MNEFDANKALMARADERAKWERVLADRCNPGWPDEVRPDESRTVLVDSFKLNRLKECTRAWEACFEAIQQVDPTAFQGHGTGAALAVRAILKMGGKL